MARSPRKLLSAFVSSLLLVAATSNSSAQQASATATAAASASASAQVGRASAWQDGKKITVKKSGKARVRGESVVQLKLRKAGLLKYQVQAKKTLATRTKARVAAQATLKAKASARVKAQATLKAQAEVLTKAQAQLDIKIKASAKAEAKLQVAKKDQATYQASAKGSFSFSFDGKGKKLKKKVSEADAEVAKAKKEEQAARDDVKKAQKSKDDADKKLNDAKKDETKAKDAVSTTEKEEAASSEELTQVDQDLKETEEQIQEQTPAQDTPAAEEEVVVVAPPSEPSDNVFGYEEPVWGCFEGQVMFIEADSTALPKDYSKYDVSSRVYACEWDIPTRAWEQGFPGIEDKFEWFAIRYSGMFSLSQAGNYKFKISSDDGTKLYIDGQLVINNDGAHATKAVEGNVQLAAGDHELVLEYFQGPRYHIALQVWVTPPGGSEQIFSVRK